MASPLLEAICGHIEETTGRVFQGRFEGYVGGGCISQGQHLSDGATSYFVKINEAQLLSMFEAEAVGLNALGDVNGPKVPRPLCYGTCGAQSYLVMEWMAFEGSGDYSLMGRKLAQLHQQGQHSQYGFGSNNYIGATVQVNTWEDTWAEFFMEHRLGFQIKLARRKGGHFPQYECFAERAVLMLTHETTPTLLHGDLWSGNAAFAQGEPVIFDPATYFGDREADLAMTRLFGGFPETFYRAYDAQWPLPPGWQERVSLYNLYHILNHYNLFGGHYEHQANQIMERLLDL